MSHHAGAGISRCEQTFKEHQMPGPQADNAKYIACAEIVPDCTFTASAATEEELMIKVAAHAAHDHGITEVTPELAAQVKAAIKSR
jgi:predicted small metal-binding protein